MELGKELWEEAAWVFLELKHQTLRQVLTVLALAAVSGKPWDARAPTRHCYTVHLVHVTDG